jgi:hypothetical protein
MRLIGSNNEAPEGYPKQMAKLNHQKRHRPRPATTRRRRVNLQRAEEQRSRREVERWRRSA